MRKVERKRMNSEHKKYFLVGSLCIAIFLMLGIGYAVLSQQLDINGTAQITSNWKILFTSAEEKEMTNATTTRKEISNQTRLLVREKIETNEQFLFYKEQINREIQELISKKHNLWIKHKRVKTEEEKLLIRSQINEITKELKAKRKEVVLCDGIEKRSKDIEESIKELEEKRKERDK